MPIRIDCPECQEAYNLADDLAGKKIRCRRCEHVFAVAVRGKAAAEKPRGSDTTEMKSRSTVIKPPSTAKRREERSNDPDRDSRPRRKRPAPSSGSSTAVIVGAVAGGLVLLLVVGGVVAFFALGRSKDATTTTAQPNQVQMDPAFKAAIDRQQAQSARAVEKAAKAAPKETPKKAPNEPAKKAPSESPRELVSTRSASSGSDIYEYTLKSVAWILARQGAGASTGTGTLVDQANRLVLTNYHVIHGNTEIVVFFPVFRDGKLLAERNVYLQQARGKEAVRANVVSTDQRKDLALIQLDRLPSEVEALPIALQSVGPGQTVHSVGNPGSSGGLWIYTSGTVRQVYNKEWLVGDDDLVMRLKAKVVETQSPTNPGDSGGPLVSDAGELVGVTQGGAARGQLLSIFIDVSEAADFIERHFKSTGSSWVRPTRTSLVRRESELAAAVPDLIKNLGDVDSTARAKAAQSLGSMGPAARISVPALMKLLRDPDDLVRRLTLEALKRIGPPEKTDLPLLIAAVTDFDSNVRGYAIEALGRVGPDARSAAPALIGALRDSDPAIRQGAARTMGRIGPAVRTTAFPALAEAIKDDKEREVRVAAAESLINLAPMTASEVPALLAILKYEDADIQVQAARALGKTGTAAKAGIRPLLDGLQDTDKRVRQAALEALPQVGITAKEMVPEVQKALKDKEVDVRRTAVESLANFGSEPKLVVPVLQEALKDKSLRNNALAALGKIGPDARDAAIVVSDLLKDADKTTRVQAAMALGDMKPTAPNELKTIVPRLILLLDQRDEIVFITVDSLVKIGRPTVPYLALALRNSSSQVRKLTVIAFIKMGPDARDALQALNYSAQTDPSPEVRELCIEAIRVLR